MRSRAEGANLGLVWTFTMTSLSAYRGKRGLDPKGAVDQREAEDDEPGLPAR